MSALGSKLSSMEFTCFTCDNLDPTSWCKFNYRWRGDKEVACYLYKERVYGHRDGGGDNPEDR